MNRKILFVGAFKSSLRDGTIGGQITASNLLIETGQRSGIVFLKVDSTMLSVPPPNIIFRCIFAVRRIVKVIYYLLFYRPDAILVLASSGFSFIEKGIMILCAKLLFTKSIISPRSGLIPTQINRYKIFELFVKLTFKNVDYVWCQSNHWKDYYSGFVTSGENKFVLMENWIDRKNIRVEPSNTEVRNILYMARIEKDKGIIEFIKSIALLYKTGLKIHVDLCGHGRYMAKTLELIERKGIKDVFTIHGFVDGVKKRKIFEKADVFVFPSHYEGYPNSVVEALSYGKIVVASRIPEIEAIIDENVNGLLFKVSDEQDLFEVLRKVTVNPDHYLQIRINALEHIQKFNSASRPVEFLKQMD